MNFFTEKSGFHSGDWVTLTPCYRWERNRLFLLLLPGVTPQQAWRSESRHPAGYSQGRPGMGPAVTPPHIWQMVLRAQVPPGTVVEPKEKRGLKTWPLPQEGERSFAQPRLSFQLPAHVRPDLPLVPGLEQETSWFNQTCNSCPPGRIVQHMVSCSSCLSHHASQNFIAAPDSRESTL